MAKVPLTSNRVKTGTFIRNVESVGLSGEQLFQLCGDNPQLRLELTAQKCLRGPELPGFVLDLREIRQ